MGLIPEPQSDEERQARADDAARRIGHAQVDHAVPHRPPTARARLAHEQLRREVSHLGHLIVEICPPGRETERAVDTLINEVLSLSNAAVARNHDRLTEPGDFDEWSYP